MYSKKIFDVDKLRLSSVIETESSVVRVGTIIGACARRCTIFIVIGDVSQSEWLNVT